MRENGIMATDAIGKDMDIYLEHPNKIWQGSNGKWYTYVGSGKERKLVKRADKTSLENYIWELHRVDSEDPTFARLFKAWITSKLEMKEITLQTSERYSVDYDRFIKGSALESKHISEITEDDLDIFIRRTVMEHQLTSKAYSGLRTILLGVFKYAKRWHYTDFSISNFFKDFDISSKSFKKPERHPETAVFHEDEIQKLLLYLYANPTVEHLGLILAFQTGIRVGELAAIKWEDVHEDILHVRRQEITYKSSTPGKREHVVVEYTKTEAGDRYIFLPETSLNVLMSLRWENRTGEYIMMKNGKRINKSTFHHVIVNACNAVDIPPRSMHKIRRTYGTTLIDNGVEDSLIMSQMGHANISTTRTYYYYANKDTNKKKEQINKAITF